MIFVVDASVAAKWFVEEEGSEEARRLLDHLAAATATLHAPDLIVAEMGNLLWRKCRMGELTALHADGIMLSLPNYLTSLEPMANMSVTALALAHDLNHPIYDCLYLSCALNLNATVVTADRRFLKAVMGTRHANRLRIVDDVPSVPRRRS